MLVWWYRSGREDVRALLITSLNRMAAERTSRFPQSVFALALDALSLPTPLGPRPAAVGLEAIERCDASRSRCIASRLAHPSMGLDDSSVGRHGYCI